MYSFFSAVWALVSIFDFCTGHYDKAIYEILLAMLFDQWRKNK